MEKLGLAGLFNTPEQQGNYAVGPESITSDMYGVSPDVYGPPGSYNGGNDFGGSYGSVGSVGSSTSNYGSRQGFSGATSYGGGGEE